MEAKYTLDDMKRAFETGRNYQVTGENYFNELIESINKALLLGNVTNRIYKCERCGTLYQIMEGQHIPCCTMYAEHRTSAICGGGLFEIIE